MTYLTVKSFPTIPVIVVGVIFKQLPCFFSSLSFDIGIGIDPRDSQSLRSGIETLYSDTGRYEELRRNLGKAHITLDWENEEKKLHELLADILIEKA